MPANEPRLGEAWIHRDTEGRVRRAFIADATADRVTLVTSTGNRLVLAFTSFRLTWQLEQETPWVNRACVRSGCPNDATLTFQRGSYPEFVCARHLPIGVIASVATPLVTREEVREEIQAQRAIGDCPSCELDHVVEKHIKLTYDVPLFECLACGVTWGDIHTILDKDLDECLKELRELGAYTRTGSYVEYKRGAFHRNVQPAKADILTSGTTWMNRSTKVLVEIVEVDEVTRDPQSRAVKFRSCNSVNGTAIMLEADFLDFHLPVDTSPPCVPIEGEEYERQDDPHTRLFIREVNLHKWIARVENGKTKSAWIGFREIAKWRRIVRQSAFQRLIDEDE